MRSAPAPRPGSSGRCGRSGSSPVTRRNASTGSVPGSDPTPEAGPHWVGAGLGSSVPPSSLPGAVLSSGPSVGEATAKTVARRRGSLLDGQTGLAWSAGGGLTGECSLKYATAVSTSTGPVTGLVPVVNAVKASPPATRKEFATTR